MTTFFTSDHHFGHANIIRYCNRPFKDADHMNEVMVQRWNEVVGPDDTVYHVGDFVMSPAHYLRIAERLNGRKLLVPGNHDHPFFGKKVAEYSKYFELLPRDNELFGLHVAHLPYAGDHPDYGERYKAERPMCAGLDQICGHVHDLWKLKWHGANVIYNVGVDVHDFYPVSLEQVQREIREYRGETP